MQVCSITKMTSTEVQETLLDATEFDSESCSSDDRCTNKRLGTDLESTGPKKRRKQTTPVRFPTCLMISDRHESEDEEDEDENMDTEGKMLNSHQAKSFHAQSAQDENRDADNQCRLCNQSFDDMSTLNQHLKCEHYMSTDSPQQQQTKTLNSIKTELDASQIPEQSTSPVNLSSISIKNFTTWIPTQSSIPTQTQKEDWPPNPSRLSLPEHIQSLPSFPNSLTQYLHYPGFPLSDTSQLQARSSIGPIPPRIFNRDAYCDLCNKEFCNKYFLKTHKANKHGIYSDTSSQSSTGDTAITGPVSFSTSNIKAEQQIQQSEGSAPSPFEVSPKPSFSCDICQKRFKSEDLVKNHKQKVHEEMLDLSDSLTRSDDKREIISSQSPSMMEMLFKQEYGAEHEDSTSNQPAKSMGHHAVQFMTESVLNIEQLHKLGVINSETFCKICCKEFSNKFFLQAHQVKCHSVFLQTNDKSLTTSDSWHHTQTSPLNLIVNESMNNSEGDRDDEQECRMCGIRFQTTELYEIHRQRIHDEKLKSPNNDPESSDQKVDTISEDLQKLQTMILQLNGLQSQKKESMCSICGAEFENKSLLQMHISSEHEYTSENISKLQEIEKSPSNNITYCNICEKDFLSEETLRKHINEDHPPSTPSSINLSQVPSVPISNTSKTSSQQERKPVSSMTPTSSYCEICNKELCNKYFMKTHMHRMHGIEISNGAQIGGVICNICNKELCSKYFLRVHKHNTHGIVDESTPVPIKQDSFDASSSEDNSLKPEHPNDLSNRYFSHFTEVCPICSRRFRSVKWLKAHLLGDHGKIGVEKWREFEEQYPVTRIGTKAGNTSRSSQASPGLKIPNGQEIIQQQNRVGDFTTLGTQVLSNLFGSSTDDQRSKNYRCSLCNFTTTALPFLFLHERTHTNPQGMDGNQSFQCPVCSQAFSKLEMLHHHLLSSHQFPSMISQFQSPVLNNFTNKESKENTSLETKMEKRQDSQVGYSNETESYSIQKTDPATIEVTPQGAYKCAQCGFATANLNRIKKHVKKDHKSIGDVTDSVIAELSRTLKEVANKHKLPATYAIPQDMNSNPDKTIMQPFLIEEYEVGVQGTDDCNPINRFAPAIVYLPVKARVNTVLTASFTLSPA